MSHEELPRPVKSALFTSSPERGLPSMAAVWGIAGGVVLLIVGILLLSSQRKPALSAHAIQPLDPYGSRLALSGIQMSESASLSAVKVTYIDGEIRNNGNKTVSGATVQVLFANDDHLPPQIETVPITLIRTHEPYIDTEPIRMAPMKPGDQREFRLIFENIGANWNQQLPEIRVTAVE